MAGVTTPLRLTYSEGWILLRAYLAMVTFLVALVLLSVLHPLLFDPPLTAATLWAGILMPVPLWFASHQVALLVLRGVLWPLGIPGRLALDADGVSLRQGRSEVRLRWAEVVEVHTGEAPLDLEAARGVHPGGRTLAQAGAALAAKDWHLTFVTADDRRLEARSRGFSRPVRRAEPRLRAWLEAHLGERLGPLSETQRLVTSSVARPRGDEGAR